MKRFLPVIIIVTVLVLALGGGLLLLKSSQDASSQPFVQTSPTPTPTAPQSSPQGSPQTTPVAQQTPLGPDNPHARGNLNAKVTLDEYGDYQCPSCGAVFFLLKSLEKEYGDRVRFVFHQYPLPGHKHALAAAHAAEAAALQNRFWEMHDMIYQNQASWTDSEDASVYFIQYAQNLGLDVERFKRDMNSPEVADRVSADHARGDSIGVKGTPTIFINGQEVRPEVVTDEGLHLALNYMLGRTK